jgi:hypothetical protein
VSAPVPALPGILIQLPRPDLDDFTITSSLRWGAQFEAEAALGFGAPPSLVRAFTERILGRRRGGDPEATRRAGHERAIAEGRTARH